VAQPASSEALERYTAVCHTQFQGSESTSRADVDVDELCTCMTDWMSKLSTEDVELLISIKKEADSAVTGEPRNRNSDPENDVANYEDGGLAFCTLAQPR
jgi:hypothetical protein